MFKKMNEYNEKVHFKMYKKGKTWVYAGIAIFSFAVGVGQLQVTPIQAASAPVTATATAQVSSSAAASTADQATATATEQVSSAASVQSATDATANQASATAEQASAEKAAATQPASNASSATADQTSAATETASTTPAATIVDTTNVTDTSIGANATDSVTPASNATQSTDTVSSSVAVTPVVATTSQAPAASSTAAVVYQSPQTKSLQDVGTTTVMPDGFSVSDPDHPDWVYAEPADSEWYTFAQMNSVSFEINRANMTTVRVGTVAGTSGQLTISDYQTLPTASNDVQVLKYGGLSIFNNTDSIYVVGSLSSIYDVLQYPNGTKEGFGGFAFFKPVNQTQITRYVDKNNNDIAPAVEITGLSGQKYETVPSADLTGYTPTDSGNTKGTMSPWTENGQTKSQIIYDSTTLSKKGEIVYKVKDVNTGEITFTTPGSTSTPYDTDLTYDFASGTSTFGKAFGSYNVRNPYLPQTTNITYTYDAEDVPVTINYVDQNNQVIQASTTTDIGYQATGTIAHPELTGYTYDSSYTATTTDNPDDYTVNTLNNNQVTLHYQANPEQVTIQHVDEKGTPIANISDTVINTKFNETLNIDDKTDQNYTISGYELNAAANNPATYQVVDGENTVVLHYIQQHPVTVNYADQTGQPLDQSLLTNAPTTLQGIVDETLTVTSPTITGYTAYTDNPTQYTVTADANAVTLHYIQTKMPVSVALTAESTDTTEFHDAAGDVIELGDLVDASATNGPKWPTTLAADGLTGATTSSDTDRNDMVRVVTENVYTYDQSGTQVPKSVELAYFTRTATVDFSNPDQPTVVYDGPWTAVEGAQTVTEALGSDYLPDYNYVLGHEIYKLPEDEQAFAFDQNGQAIALTTATLGGKTAQVVPAQQVTADTANFNVYVVYAKTANLTKTYTRTVHFVDQAGAQVSPDKTQTVTYTRTPILNMTNPTAPTVSQYTDWTTTNAEFAQVDAPTVTGQAALTSSIPAAQTAATDTTLNTETTITYVDATQTVQVNYVGTPADYQPTQTSVTGTVNTDTTLTPDSIEGYQADETSYPVSFAVDTKGTLETPSITVTYTPANHAYSITPVDESGKPIPGTTAKPETGTTDDVIDSKTYPEVPGYTAETTEVKVPKTDTAVPVVYTPNTVSATIAIPATGLSTSAEKEKLNVPATGVTNQDITVTVPDVTGYTHDKTTITAHVTPEGTITSTDLVTYTPNTVQTTTTIPSTGLATPAEQKLLTDVPVSGATDETVTITVPTVEGYTTTQKTTTVTINPDGTVTPNETIAYTPAIHAYSITPVDKEGNPLPGTTAKPENGTTDEVIDNKTYPDVPGYMASATEVKVPTSDTNVNVIYTPNDITTTVTIPSNKGDQTVPNITGTVGTTVDVTVPEVAGYTPDKTTVPVTVNPDGTITTTEKVEYTGNSVTADVTIPSNKGNQVVTDVPGVVGETVNVTVPTVEGYTPDKTTVPATVNPDGTITTTEKVEYTGNSVTTTVTIPSNKGNQTVPDITGTVGTTVDVTVPEVEGYTPDKTTVPATVNPDGTITTTEKVEYTGNPVTATVTIPSNKGNQTVPEITGTVGNKVDVTVPEVAGYTPDKTTVPATVNPDGTITTTEKVEYTGNPVTADLTIPSNKGDQVVTDVPGTVGETIDVTVLTYQAIRLIKTQCQPQ